MNGFGVGVGAGDGDGGLGGGFCEGVWGGDSGSSVMSAIG